MHPTDVGDQRDPLPGSQVLDADLEILPKGPARHPVELAHHDEESDITPGRRLFEGGQHGVPKVLGSQLAGRLETDHPWRHAAQCFDHRPLPLLASVTHFARWTRLEIIVLLRSNPGGHQEPGGPKHRRRRGHMIPRIRPTPLSACAICLVLMAGLLAACSSTNSTGSTANGSSTPPIPASAFQDHTGVTTTSVTIGNVSTQVAGLFTGAVVGTEAYAAYVNSQGGVNGRKIVVSSVDDQFQGALNKQEVQTVLQSDFASVGGLSLEDSFSEPLIAANPGFPDITASLDPATEKLPEQLQPAPGLERMADRSAPLLQAEVPDEDRPHGHHHRRPAVDGAGLGQREERPCSTWATRCSTTRRCRPRRRTSRNRWWP